MVHDPEVKALKVRYVAGNMQGQDLSLSVGRGFRPRGKSLNDQTALAGTTAVRHDDFTGAKMPLTNPQALNGADVFAIQVVRYSEFRNER